MDSTSWLRKLKNTSLRRLVVNTLFQEVTNHHNQKDGFRETRKVDPYWKLRPVSCLYGKHGIETRIWSLTLNPGSEFLMDQINLWLIRTTQKFLSICLKNKRHNWRCRVFACRSKAKAEPQRRELVDSPSIIPMNERKWIDIEPGNSSLSAYEISKKVIHLLRHSQQVQREDDGAIQFWRIKNYLQSQCPQVPYWSDDRWKVSLAAGGGAKRRYQYCTDIFRNNRLFPSSSRTFRTQPYWSFITGQCGNSERILPTYLPHWMCFQSSFYHQQWIWYLEVRIQARDRQYSFCLMVAETKGIKILKTMTWMYHVVHNTWHSAWKKHQDAVDINLAIRKGLTFYQTRSNAIILQGILPACCIPKVVRLKTGEVLCKKSYMSLRPPPNWVLQLINNQKKKLFDSHEEKFLDKQHSPN